MDLTQTILILFFNLVIVLSSSFLFSIIIIILASIKISLTLENSKKILFVGFIALCVYNVFLLEILLETILTNTFGISIISKLLFLIYGCIYVYVLIYIKYGLPLSFLSFCCFFCNFFIVFLYLYSCISISRSTPIFLEDLSYFSLYRYGLVLLVSLVVVLVFIIFKIIKVESINYNLINKFNIPHLKEEVRLFMINSIPEQLTTLVRIISEKMYTSVIVRKIYIGISFFMNYFIVFLQNIFFFNFVFFHGDLRWNLYLIPLSFLAWIFKNFEYSFIKCLQDDAEYLQQVLVVSWKNAEDERTYVGKKEPIQYDPNALEYIVTPYGIQEGFNQKYVHHLAFIFVRTYNCLALFTMFYKRFRFLKIFNFCFRILCLFGVFFDVTFFKDFCSFGLCNYLFRIPNKAAHALLHMPQRPYATRAVVIKREFDEKVAKETEGMYSKGHPLAIDPEIKDEHGNYRIEYQFTHGKGPKNNPSVKLSDDKDVQGKSVPQSGVCPFEINRRPHLLPEAVKSVIPGSEEYCRRPDVRENIAKATYKNWEEENT